MRSIILFVFLILNTFSFAQKEYWTPSWEDMISKSVAIALVEYTSNGKYTAKAKVLKLYKGEIPETEILVTDFNKMHCGLEHIEPAKKRDQYIMFFKKYEGNTYHLWSGYSGDYLVDDTLVKYDLNRSKNSRMRHYYSLHEFEQFLIASLGIEQDVFQKYALTELKALPNYKYNELIKYIMMLKITGYDQYDEVYKKALERNFSGVEYALAQLLGQVKTESSLEILTNLSKSEHEKVATEAKKQLAEFELHVEQ